MEIWKWTENRIYHYQTLIELATPKEILLVPLLPLESSRYTVLKESHPFLLNGHTLPDLWYVDPSRFRSLQRLGLGTDRQEEVVDDTPHGQITKRSLDFVKLTASERGDIPAELGLVNFKKQRKRMAAV